MIYYKIHKSYRDVVAICDTELINKVFEENKKTLELKENFFKDKKVDEKEIKEIMKKFSVEDATFNIVGERSIKCALELGMFSEQGVKKIQGVPFALILL